MSKIKTSKAVTKSVKNTLTSSTNSNSAPIAELGVRDSEQFSKLMSAIMGDVLNGRITTDVANSTCNAGGKLLKCIEMQYKYGTRKQKTPKLLLA